MFKVFKLVLILLSFFIGYFGMAAFFDFQPAEESAEQGRQVDKVIVPNDEQSNVEPPVTMLFVGDIMLGRYVETLMNSAGANYPFEKISQFLSQFDLVSGNLEGPIVKDYQQTPYSSTRFSFAPNTAEILRRNNFKLVSLANNHTFDYGEIGLQETRNFLTQFVISASGDPLKIDESNVVVKDIRGQKIAFASFNFTSAHPNERNGYDLIQNIKKQVDFVVVSIHWGQEYTLQSSSRQKTIAHNLIDNGADLIIGHHPHVVQEIENYKNKIIFYSLGNFIFDQYFSKHTQEGLIVSADISGGQVSYQLFPIDILQSQPALVDSAKAQEWLSELSIRSDANLTEQIKSGVIVVSGN